MGVKGLWRLLLPIGRRISIEVLEGQILAVDASIWMTQFLKALRDPDSGQVRPAAHIIGFFRRLCKLRFHGIRPVFVFDGATPEIKRRELQLRRRRRDQFVATHGAAAVQRMAKRLLMEQLRKSKSKVSVGKDKAVKIKTGGAFAAGFNLPDQAKENSKEEGKEEEGDAKYEWTEGEYRITAGGSNNDADTEDTEVPINQNDWDKPIEIDQSDEEGQESAEEREQETVEYDDVLWTNRGRKRKNFFGAPKPKRPDDFFNEEYVLTLPPTERKEAIEHAKKKQRMLSRKEFMPHAGNADEYSRAQVLNFLRSCKLNRDIVTMAKKAVHLDHKEGEVMASDRSRRVVFQKSLEDKKTPSSSEDERSDSDDDEGGGFLDAKQRPTAARRLQSKQQQFPAEQSSPPQQRRIRKVGFRSSGNDDSSDEEGAGFFVADSSTAGSKASKRRAITDEDEEGGYSDNSDGGGGFVKSNVEAKGGNSSTQEEEGVAFFPTDDPVPTIHLEKDDEGLVYSKGFQQSDSTKASTQSEQVKRIMLSATADGLNTGGTEAIVEFKSGGFFSTMMEPSGRDATKNTGLSKKGAHFWRDGSDDSDDDMQSSLGASAAAKKNAKRVAQRLKRTGVQFDRQQTAMPYAIFQADDDDGESSKGGSSSSSSSLAKPLALLKSTGLDDDEVVVIDEKEVDGSAVGARKAQELQDQMLAKVLQEEEDAEIAATYMEEIPPADAGLSSKTEKVRKSVSWESSGIEGPSTRRSTEVFVGCTPKKLPSQSQVAVRKPATGVVMMGEDEEDDDDIDWENGDDPSGIEMESNGLMAKDAEKKVSHQAPASISAGSNRESSGRFQPNTSDDEIDWEDGDGDLEEYRVVAPGKHGGGSEGGIAAAGEKNSSAHNSDETLQHKQRAPDASSDHHNTLPRKYSASSSTNDPFFRQPLASSNARENHLSWQQSVATEGSGLQADRSKRQSRETSINFDSDGEAGVFSIQQKDDTQAALHQAETTAANLTNWAGRAVRRAIAEHLGGGDTERLPAFRQEVQQNNSDSDVEVIGQSYENRDEGKMLTINEENAEKTERMMEDYEAELADVANGNIEQETEQVTDEMQEEIKQLLRLFGVPYVQAPAEAEAQCVALEQLGLVNGIVTEDSDVFIFGGKTVYKNIFDDQKYVEEYRANDAEREMGLGGNEFVALAMLLGGDYTEGVKGVGIVNGMEIVSSFDVSRDLKQGLQKFREWLDGFEPVIDANAKKEGGKSLTKEQMFHIKHRTARKRWDPPENFPSDAVISAYVNPVVDTSKEKFSWGVPNLKGICDFVGQNVGWATEETKQLLQPVIERVQNKRSHQTRIDQFMRYEHGIKFASVRSERLRRVLQGREGDLPEALEPQQGVSTRSITNEDVSRRRNTQIPNVAFDTRTVRHEIPHTSPYFANRGSVRAEDESSRVLQTETNEETLVSVLAPDAFTDSELQQEVSVSAEGTKKSKHKVKALMSYLSNVEPEPESKTRVYSEQLRAQLNKPVLGVAPPAYSTTSELAATLRQKSRREDETVPREKDEEEEE